MKILVACERSGRVRDAFRKLGHAAVSCDLYPTDAPGPHYKGDIRKLLSNCYGWRDGGEYYAACPAEWDMLIAFPDCTYLTSSGLHWNNKRPGRAQKTEEALAFVRWLMELPIPRIAIENPQGCIGTRIRPADQYIQPYEFGEDASKKTGLWLKNLPLLKSTKRVPGRIVMVNGKPVERWANQTDSGQNRLGPSEDRAKLRAVTYQGIANAMADQWGKVQ